MRAIVTICLLACAATLAGAQSPIDSHTTFMASFDQSMEPDYAAGDWRGGAGGAIELVEGRSGNALFIPAGQSVMFSADQKINLAAGAVEFWLLWTEEMADAEGSLGIFTMVTPEAGNYLNFNVLATGRLGMPVKQGPPGEGEWTWQRIDVDPSVWETPSWHHLAGVWEGGTTSLYVDGELVGTEEGGAGFVELPREFALGRGPLTIDELRISSVARSAEEIAASVSAEPGEPSTLYLSHLEPTAEQQAVGRVGINSTLGVDERRLPLAIGSQSYARGISLRAPGFVEFTVPEGVTSLQGISGISPFGREGAAATLVFSLAGDVIESCPDLSADDRPLQLSLPVEPGQTLRIEAVPADDTPGGIAVFGDAILLAEGVEPPPSFSREMAPEELAVQQMQARAAEFQFELPEAPQGYVIYAGHPVDEVDPSAEPQGERFPQALGISAAPNEYEAAKFDIYAARDLSGITVTASDLTGPGGAIGGEDVQVQLILRGLMRRLYTLPRTPENFGTVSRFIFPASEFWLPEGSFKEVYVLVHVPEGTASGAYTGTITVAADDAEPTQMALNLNVRPIDLIQSTDKRYGMYYRAASLAGRPEEVNDAEFADMAAHGCSMIKGHTAITWRRDEAGEIGWDFGLIRTTLDQCREHGFFGEITIYDNLMALQALMGLPGINDEGEGEPVSENEELLAVARAAFAELKQVEAEYPEFEFLLTHMDEVFGRGRLPKYIDLAEVIRKTSDFRIFITMHMNPGHEPFLEEADPWIDVRCINGHSLETWLQSGHDWEDLAQMLADAGDDGWIYHNQRGSFFKPEWNRFINGLFMWVSPLEVHVPWMYYSISGDPFDDTDADGHDFAYAVPHPDDPTLMISTMHYQAFREGYDDMRYIKTLEQAIAEAQAAGVETAEAQGWLEEMRAMLPQLPEDIQGIELESPYSVAAERRFTGADWDAMRERTAQQIAALRGRM